MYQAHIEPFTEVLETVPAGDVPARDVYRHLVSQGLSAEQAGNITARVKGLSPSAAGWQLPEIERLLFLRWRVEHDLVPA